MRVKFVALLASLAVAGGFVMPPSAAHAQASLTPTTRGASAPSATRQAWEYKVVRIVEHNELALTQESWVDGQPTALEAGWMSALGRQGWELVSVANTASQGAFAVTERGWYYFFRRPLSAAPVSPSPSMKPKPRR